MSVWDLYDTWKLKGFDDGFDDPRDEEEASENEENEMKAEYEPKNTNQVLAHAVEECGELLAALGKSQRWGLDSVNPELPASEQETNADWVLRESEDVLRAVLRLRNELLGTVVPKGPLYGDRDIMGLDRAGGHYCAHIMAMTREELHNKGAIAAELAYRDHKIALLEEALRAEQYVNKEARLRDLMPPSWTDLIELAQSFKKRRASNAYVDHDALLRVIDSVTDFCPHCSGDGVVVNAGNIDDCSCGQRSK